MELSILVSGKKENNAEKYGVLIKNKGIYEFSDGTYYEGYWKDHRMHGEGLFIDKNGKKWEGEFVEGTFQSKL
jgi:hypothetical protein